MQELNNPYQNHSFSILKQSTILKSFLLKGEFIQTVEKKLKLLTLGKGIYPYALCGDSKTMKKIKEFPEIKMFFNDLTNSPCSEEDYKFGLKIYKAFNCKNLYEYTILYNHCDTLLLAEIMMTYRKIIQDHFDIDVNHFLGIPSLAFNLMLKISKVKIELLSDPEINFFFRNSIRGGMSFIGNRHAKSGYYNSNVKNYKQRTNHIRYIDANNLYGSMMLFNMPIGDYKFENDKFIQKIMKKLKKSKNINCKERGYFLEVDLNYPKKLHSLHSNFPLAPEKYNVMYDELSPLNKFLHNLQKQNVSKKFCEEKLIATFHDRKNYILHIKCLIFYLSKGMILKKIHRIVSFKQAPFLNEYITILTKLRSDCAAKNLTFFVNVFKLLANSTYGKFAQSPLNYTFAKICFKKSHFKKV